MLLTALILAVVVLLVLVTAFARDLRHVDDLLQVVEPDDAPPPATPAI
ncbi:MAG: hypothetical protein AAF624_12310 [Bacteroidota bacterium]